MSTDKTDDAIDTVRRLRQRGPLRGVILDPMAGPRPMRVAEMEKVALDCFHQADKVDGEVARTMVAASRLLLAARRAVESRDERVYEVTEHLERAAQKAADPDTKQALRDAVTAIDLLRARLDEARERQHTAPPRAPRLHEADMQKRREEAARAARERREAENMAKLEPMAEAAATAVLDHIEANGKAALVKGQLVSKIHWALYEHGAWRER
jgi:hypothetical protein